MILRWHQPHRHGCRTIRCLREGSAADHWVGGIPTCFSRADRSDLASKGTTITITDLPAVDFTEFFTALWNKRPFRWQAELAKRVLEREKVSADLLDIGVPSGANGTAASSWPDTIALPTASGKTACMDIALFVLAAQASRIGSKQPITAPRRIFFVVDRRVIVDEAYERARRLACKLAQAQDGVLKIVADALRHIACGEEAGFEKERPLVAYALRGGIYRSEAWARNPLQPIIVASTVDQVGSRLLFRAYGRSFGTWPVYAALVANDSLILLDEAHCAQPFLQTLRTVCHYRTWAQEPIQRCFHPVVMSATPPNMNNVFRDLSGEGRDPDHPLGRRQLARKPALLQVPNADGDETSGRFSKALADCALNLLTGGRQAIVVFVNRVATARETFRLLHVRDDVEAVLLTGRMRPVDKDAVVRRLYDLGLHSDQSAGRCLEKPVIAVATQTLEVGADLDFDGLVTECASLDALRQRFGRLNRMGRNINTRAAILMRADQARPTRDAKKDPVYGEALIRTWKWLNDRKNEHGEVDFGTVHLDDLLTEDDSLADLYAPSPDAPVMLPAHVDCWAQTAPEPRPTPEVAHFLHGQREGAPDVHVCWRADINLTNPMTQDDAIESLTLCPPSSGETLPLPTGVFQRWLAGKDSDDLGADVEGVRAAEEGQEKGTEGSSPPDRRVVRWRGAETSDKHVTSDPADIRPGDVIVIPCMHSGIHSQLGDFPPGASDSSATLDVGDAAHRLARDKPILRLHPALVDAWADSVPAKATARSLLNGVAQKYEDNPNEVANAAYGLLMELSKAEALPDRWAWLSRTARDLRTEFSTVAKLRRECRLVGAQCLVLAGRRRIMNLAHGATAFSDEDDAAASGISHRDGRPVPLRTHLPGVETFARRYAAGCGLPDELVDAVARAGLLHDVGKADPRFQAMLRGGTPWLAGEPLAKSAKMPKTPSAWESARTASGYPAGGRHELLSVRMAETAPALLPDDDDLRDLVLHLVASHHGHCRPFAPFVVDDRFVSVEYALRGNRMHWSGPTKLERLNSGVADRYWRLTRRYGWWGLAWLEALLRLADWRRSEWEEVHNADG